jgi:hypothetical protein
MSGGFDHSMTLREGFDSIDRKLDQLSRTQDARDD